ncbi:MAG: Ig-like domain repeat protein, partial [bacterium]
AGVPDDGKRDIPDVSFFTAGDLGAFYVICQADLTGAGSCDLNAPYQDFLPTVGGTSIAAPEFAGVMALVDQKTDSRQGNANYVLYKLAAQQDPANCGSNGNPAPDCIFNDIVQGTNRVPCVSGSPACGTDNPSLPIGILNGYDAGVGYDLTTGLGSINVTNLVQGWPSVTFAATRTNLTVLPSSLTHGQSANIRITVTSNQGVPSGQVSLVTSDNQAVAVFMLGSGGVVSATTNALPGGVYKVFARYGGDGTFAQSESRGFLVVVGAEQSKTAPGVVTFDPNTGAIVSENAQVVAFGSPYILDIDVTNKSRVTCVDFNTQQQHYACPTGSVTLTDHKELLDGGLFAL